TRCLVTVRNSDGESRGAAIDADGNYRIDDAPGGGIEVFAEAEGSDFRQVSKSVFAEAAPGSETRLDLAFTPQVAVHGRVTRGGTPLEHDTVRFGVTDTEGTGAKTGAGGVYAIQVVPGEYEVTIASNGEELPFIRHVVVTGAAEVNLDVM